MFNEKYLKTTAFVFLLLSWVYAALGTETNQYLYQDETSFNSTSQVHFVNPDNTYSGTIYHANYADTANNATNSELAEYSKQAGTSVVSSTSGYATGAGVSALASNSLYATKSLYATNANLLDGYTAKDLMDAGVTYYVYGSLTGPLVDPPSKLAQITPPINLPIWTSTVVNVTNGQYLGYISINTNETPDKINNGAVIIVHISVNRNGNSDERTIKPFVAIYDSNQTLEKTYIGENLIIPSGISHQEGYITLTNDVTGINSSKKILAMYFRANSGWKGNEDLSVYSQDGELTFVSIPGAGSGVFVTKNEFKNIPGSNLVDKTVNSNKFDQDTLDWLNSFDSSAIKEEILNIATNGTNLQISTVNSNAFDVDTMIWLNSLGGGGIIDETDPKFFGAFDYADSNEFIFTSGPNPFDTVTIIGWWNPLSRSYLRIPPMIGGKKVTAIGDTGVFANQLGLQVVELPESINYIGDVAFYGCTYLTNIYLLGEQPALGSGGYVFDSSPVTIYHKAGYVYDATLGGAPTALFGPTNFGSSIDIYVEAITNIDGSIVVTPIEGTGVVTISINPSATSSFVTAEITNGLVGADVDYIDATNKAITAYGWGNHADAGYWTAFPSHIDQSLYLDRTRYIGVFLPLYDEYVDLISLSSDDHTGLLSFQVRPTFGGIGMATTNDPIEGVNLIDDTVESNKFTSATRQWIENLTNGLASADCTNGFVKEDITNGLLGLEYDPEFYGETGFARTNEFYFEIVGDCVELIQWIDQGHFVSLRIPDKIYGKPVTQIRSGFLSNNSWAGWVTNVYIPSTVTDIGSAFIACNSLIDIFMEGPCPSGIAGDTFLQSPVTIHYKPGYLYPSTLGSYDPAPTVGDYGPNLLLSKYDNYVQRITNTDGIIDVNPIEGTGIVTITVNPNYYVYNWATNPARTNLDMAGFGIYGATNIQTINLQVTNIQVVGYSLPITYVVWEGETSTLYVVSPDGLYTNQIGKFYP